MEEALSLLVVPFIAVIAFVLIHTWLGVHVLRRRIVFADLALAQLSALGATVAFAGGHTVDSVAAFAYALLFTVVGALLLSLLRGVGRYVSREAFVGILYVGATAATILVVDRSPQGAEHVKKIFVGSLLTVSPVEVAKLCALYAGIGVLHAWLRRPLLAASTERQTPGSSTGLLWMWDVVFFLSFGLVVTSSVSVAGVLLVFSFLIVPALIGSLFSQRLQVVLFVGCGVGIVASAFGLGSAYVLDLPAGAAMVAALGLFLLAAGLARVLIFSRQAGVHRRIALRATAALVLTVALVSSLWLIFNPSADQPLLSLLEHATGIGPVDFMNDGDRRIFEDAARDSGRFQAEVDRLNALEKTSRYAATPLADEEVRRIASYQRSFNEMTRGERFVQDVLRVKARRRARWFMGVPAALCALAGLALVGRSTRAWLRFGVRWQRSPA